MSKKLVFFLGLGFVCLISVSYFFGVGTKLFERVLTSRYWLASKGVGAIVPSKSETKLINGGDAGTVLQKYGIKYIFADPVYFDSVWSWGVKKKHSWLVFQYFYEGRNRWLIIPKRGEVGWIGQTDPNAKEVRVVKIGVNELSNNLVPGTIVSLGMMYRFQDMMSREQINKELIEMRATNSKRLRDDIEWEIGNYPGKVYQNEEIKRVFANDVTLINDSDIELSYVREN